MIASTIKLITEVTMMKTLEIVINIRTKNQNNMSNCLKEGHEGHSFHLQLLTMKMRVQVKMLISLSMIVEVKMILTSIILRNEKIMSTSELMWKKMRYTNGQVPVNESGYE